MLSVVVVARLISHTKDMLKGNNKNEKLCITVLQTLKEMVSLDVTFGTKVSFTANCGIFCRRLLEFWRNDSFLLRISQMWIDCVIYCCCCILFSLMEIIYGAEIFEVLILILCQHEQTERIRSTFAFRLF